MGCVPLGTGRVWNYGVKARRSTPPEDNLRPLRNGEYSVEIESHQQGKLIYLHRSDTKAVGSTLDSSMNGMPKVLRTEEEKKVQAANVKRIGSKVGGLKRQSGNICILGNIRWIGAVGLMMTACSLNRATHSHEDLRLVDDTI